MQNREKFGYLMLNNMKLLLNFLGIVIYFLVRYGNRTDKTTSFSGTFWLNDNWPETVTTLLFDIVLMLLFIAGGVKIELEKLLPSIPAGITFIGDLAIYFLIGLVLAHGAYELFKAKK
jgi:hypothetical protein